MAGQGFNRREAFRMFGIAAAVSQFAGLEQWVYAHEAHHAQQKRSSVPYKPRFFNKHEYLTVTILSDLLIPTDETPGAREAGCAEFTDFIVSHDKEQQPRFRKGLAWLDAHSERRHKKKFAALDKESQTAILETLAYKSKFKPEEKDGQDFFALMRNYTVMGYYTSKPGMEALGVPTLQTYSASPECPHHGDPEHKKMKKVKA
jgi:hypothetical protein